METLTIYYNTKSPGAELRQNRFQLLAASLSIVIGYFESFRFYTGISVVIPIIGFIIAVFNIPFAIFYTKLTQKIGKKFELLLLRTDGLIMLITGIGYQLAGSNLVPIAYYILTIMYFVVLPYFLLPVKAKRYYIRLNKEGVSLRGLVKRLQLKWSDIEFITCRDDLFKLKRTGKRKVQKFYLKSNETDLKQAARIIKQAKVKNNFD